MKTTAVKFSMGSSVSCNIVSLSVSQMRLEKPQNNSNAPHLNGQSVPARESQAKEAGV